MKVKQFKAKSVGSLRRRESSSKAAVQGRSKEHSGEVAGDAGCSGHREACGGVSLGTRYLIRMYIYIHIHIWIFI